ncbi:hypothetical protein BKA62DRAFT_288628 [Auriculariales sp. MPI-PUGE-AT-0066]|nr:hypothetical protein BKA62DRAFT_288628 [Auriculariales sp. MPI-PUGE-AT-0066]
MREQKHLLTSCVSPAKALASPTSPRGCWSQPSISTRSSRPTSPIPTSSQRTIHRSRHASPFCNTGIPDILTAVDCLTLDQPADEGRPTTIVSSSFSWSDLPHLLLTPGNRLSTCAPAPARASTDFEAVALDTPSDVDLEYPEQVDPVLPREERQWLTHPAPMTVENFPTPPVSEFDLLWTNPRPAPPIPIVESSSIALEASPSTSAVSTQRGRLQKRSSSPETRSSRSASMKFRSFTSTIDFTFRRPPLIFTSIQRIDSELSPTSSRASSCDTATFSAATSATCVEIETPTLDLAAAAAESVTTLVNPTACSDTAKCCSEGDYRHHLRALACKDPFASFSSRPA